MPRKSKEQRNAEVHALALRRFEASWNATKEDRQRAIEARRFVNIRGAQWEFDEAGDFANKIKLEIDHVGGAVTRIKNEYRKNRISARFLPADGSNADALADALAARYRADTMDGRGREARDMAFDSAVEGGFGGLRLRAEYEPGDDEKQRICLEAINDAESTLFFDVNAKRKDKSDAGHAFLITPYTKEAFEDEFGPDGSSWPEHLRNKFTYQWFGMGNDQVRVAEYFIKEDRTDTYRVWKNEITDETEEFLEDEVTEEDIAKLEAMGFKEVEPREQEVDQIVKYVMSGAKVLEGPEVIPGPNIPLIPQYGHRTVINHVERFRGHVIKAMDAQIVYNLQVSKVATTAASSVDRTPIFLSAQIAPHVNDWRDAHKTNPPFLQIEPIYDAQGNMQAAGPVGYLEPPEVAPAVGALIQLTKQDIADQLGNPENAEQLQPDISGIALDLVQGRIDMQSYNYMDGAADTERRTGEVYQGMAAVIYDVKVKGNKGRKLKIMTEDGKLGQVEIGKKVLDTKTGEVAAEIDFGRARFDVVTEVGPTSASRRSAIVRTVSELMSRTTDPETVVVLGHVALSNLEAEGMQDVRDWSRKKLLAMGVAKPTPEEQADIDAAKAQPAPPDPQAELAAALGQESQAKAVKALADTKKAQAQTELTQAQTAETLAGIPIAQQRAAVETAKAIMSETGQETPNGL